MDEAPLQDQRNISGLMTTRTFPVWR